MPALSTPDTIAGPLTAADLGRATNPGNVWLMPRRVTVAGRDTCDGSCETAGGCRCCFPDTVPVLGFLHPAEACTDIGADPDPYDGTAVIRGLMSAIGITAVIAAVVAVLA